MSAIVATSVRALAARPAGARTNSRTAARPGPQRLAVQAVASPEAPSTVSSSSSLDGARRQLEAAAAAAPAAPSDAKPRRVVLESEDELRSTWEHRAWVAGATALMASTLAQGLAQVDGPGSAAAAGAAAVAAYFMADVGTAFYHWCDIAVAVSHRMLAGIAAGLCLAQAGTAAAAAACPWHCARRCCRRPCLEQARA